MPRPQIIKLAAKAKTTIVAAEDAWEAAKVIADQKVGRSSKMYWGYVMSITKRKLGLQESLSTFIESEDPNLVAYRKATGEYNRLRRELEPWTEKEEYYEKRTSKFGGPVNEKEADEALAVQEKIREITLKLRAAKAVMVAARNKVHPGT